MAAKKHSAFEEKIIAQCGEDAFKAAKQLLKNRRLLGAWRDGGNRLHGRFEPENGTAIQVELTTGGDSAKAICNCQQADGDRLCAHGAALLLHASVFHAPPETESEPNYYPGLRQEDWDGLAKRHSAGFQAMLFLESQWDNPHAPSQWENVSLTVKIHTPERDYTGNLNNLRQLYFDKNLSVVVHYEHFSLQEQQIIRFWRCTANPTARGSC